MNVHCVGDQMKIKLDGKHIGEAVGEIIAKLKNSNRVSKYFFYTTLYGIGYFCIFMSKDTFDKTNKNLADYLKSKNIEFKNEFSDAGWVYRFVINKDVEIHNTLLDEFDL